MGHPYPNELYHHGIKGMKWGVRRYQNDDGSLTPAGERRYYNNDGTLTKKGKKFLIKNHTKQIYRESNPTKDDPYMFKAHNKSMDFKDKVEKGFAPSKKDFAKYVGPREKTASEKMREERQKNAEFYKQLIQRRKPVKESKAKNQTNKKESASSYRTGYGPEGWIGYAEWARRVEAEKRKH